MAKKNSYKNFISLYCYIKVSHFFFIHVKQNLPHDYVNEHHDIYLLIIQRIDHIRKQQIVFSLHSFKHFHLLSGPGKGVVKDRIVCLFVCLLGFSLATAVQQLIFLGSTTTFIITISLITHNITK